MNVYEKLINVQKELKAPKSQHNKFGGFNYRSCEDILEAVKPILASNKATIIISDTVEPIGNFTRVVNDNGKETTEIYQRVYVKVTAKFIDIETGEVVENTAYAREDESKKGMDASQVTGSSSSYARKYCLNGLLLIDDTKDADTDEFTKVNNPEPKKEDKPAPKNMDAQEFLGKVRFTKDNRCEVRLSGGWKDVVTCTTTTLLKLVAHPDYEKAVSAINCVLDTRSLKGEQQ